MHDTWTRLGCPHEQTLLTSFTQRSRNPKPPIPHLNAWCSIFSFSFWHSWVLCRVWCLFCSHFGREKVQFWSCPGWPLLQYTSIKNVILMLQCQIWGRGTGNAGEWETLTQGTLQGKKTNVASYLLQVSARLLLSELQTKTKIILQFKRANWWPGRTWLKYFDPRHTAFLLAALACVFPRPQILTRLADRISWSLSFNGANWCALWATLLFLTLDIYSKSNSQTTHWVPLVLCTFVHRKNSILSTQPSPIQKKRINAPFLKYTLRSHNGFYAQVKHFCIKLIGLGSTVWVGGWIRAEFLPERWHRSRDAGLGLNSTNSQMEIGSNHTHQSKKKG